MRAPRGASVEWAKGRDPVAPPPVQAGDESLGRSCGRMQTGGETAAPERYVRPEACEWNEGRIERSVLPLPVQAGGEPTAVAAGRCKPAVK